jgi:hypothetical protein
LSTIYWVRYAHKILYEAAKNPPCESLHSFPPAGQAEAIFVLNRHTRSSRRSLDPALAGFQEVLTDFSDTLKKTKAELLTATLTTSPSAVRLSWAFTQDP